MTKPEPSSEITSKPELEMEGTPEKGKLAERPALVFEKKYTRDDTEVLVGLEVWKGKGKLKIETNNVVEDTERFSKQLVKEFNNYVSIVATPHIKGGERFQLEVESNLETLESAVVSEISQYQEEGLKELEGGIGKFGSSEAYIQHELTKQESARNKAIKYAAAGLAAGLALRFAGPLIAEGIDSTYQSLIDTLEAANVDLSDISAALEGTYEAIDATAQSVRGALDAASESLGDAYDDIAASMDSMSDALEDLPVVGDYVDDIETAADNIGQGLSDAKDTLVAVRTELDNILDYTTDIRDTADALDTEGAQRITEASENEDPYSWGGQQIDYPDNLDWDGDGTLDYYQEGSQGGYAEQIHFGVENGDLTSDLSKAVHDDFEHRSQLYKAGLNMQSHASDLSTIADNIETAANAANTSLAALYNPDEETGALVDMESEVSDIETYSADLEDSVETANQNVQDDIDAAQTDAESAQTYLDDISTQMDTIYTEMDKLDGYADEIATQTQNIQLEESEIQTWTSSALGKAKTAGKTIAKIGGYALVATNLGILALPVLTGYKGYRTAKRINDLKGAPEMLNPQITYAMTDLA